MIPQYDGNDSLDQTDEAYDGSKHFWANHYLGGAYQSFIDANEVVRHVDLEEDLKQDLIADIVESRKTALGNNFRFFPSWE